MIFTLNAPMFDFLVLSIVAKEDTYGYEVSQVIKKVSNTKDSTLYPILKRLQEGNYLRTYDQQYQGRNRKYYSITPDGKQQYQMLLKEWKDYTATIDEIVNEGMKCESEFSHALICMPPKAADGSKNE